MGAESFYLNARFHKTDISPIIEKYGGICRMMLNEAEGRQELCMEGALVSFLPVCSFMFDICCELRKAGVQQLELESLKEPLPKGHMERPDFIIWMYQLWANKLESFYEQFGGFVLNPSQFYDTREKLRKYYAKSAGRQKNDALE